MSKPATVALPLVGERIVERIRTIVVLPEPLGPSSPKTWPAGTSKDTPSSARTSPLAKTRTMSWASTANSGIGSSLGRAAKGARWPRGDGTFFLCPFPKARSPKFAPRRTSWPSLVRRSPSNARVSAGPGYARSTARKHPRSRSTPKRVATTALAVGRRETRSPGSVRPSTWISSMRCAPWPIERASNCTRTSTRDPRAKSARRPCQRWSARSSGITSASSTHPMREQRATTSVRAALAANSRENSNSDGHPTSGMHSRWRSR